MKTNKKVIFYSLMLVMITWACEEEFPSNENNATLKSGSGLTDGTYELKERGDFDPLFRFIVEGNSVLLQTDPSITFWGTDFWGYWSEPYTLEGNQINSIVGLTNTTYEFTVLPNGDVDVQKTLIVTPYSGGDPRTTITNPGIYEPIE